MSAPTPSIFYVQAAPLPADFDGDLPETLQAFAARLRVIPDRRYSSFVVGATEPPTDQGPWLRTVIDGKASWYAYNTETGRYTTIEAYVEPAYRVSTNAPVDAPNPGGEGVPPEPRLWIRTSASGAHKQTYWWTGLAWSLFSAPVPSGTTRPLAPFVGEKFFDTTINVELIYERGAWRTVSGSPGDIKHVRAGTLAEAITKNPGWVEFSSGRSRALVGATPAGGLAGGNLTALTIEQRVGEENHRLDVTEIPAHSHGLNRMRSATRNVENHQLRVVGLGESNGDIDEDLNSYTYRVGGGLAHNNLPPSIALWCLEKE